MCKHQLLLPMRNLESCSAYLRAFPKWKQSTHRWSSRSLRNLIFTHSQGTSSLHSLRQQLADAANARDVARVHEQAADARAASMESLRAASEAAAAKLHPLQLTKSRPCVARWTWPSKMTPSCSDCCSKKDSDFSEAMRSAAAQAANSSAIMLELQQLYRYMQSASSRHSFYSFRAVLLCRSSRNS